MEAQFIPDLNPQLSTVDRPTHVLSISMAYWFTPAKIGPQGARTHDGCVQLYHRTVLMLRFNAKCVCLPGFNWVLNLKVGWFWHVNVVTSFFCFKILKFHNFLLKTTALLRKLAYERVIYAS